ncbi:MULTISPECIES: SIR2 family protein [unclassified Bradyrhizobium]|uniref:SIR2 family protein n=1 Tax=unclassified Bradyrhizobium TaxID=2631580 RepID=UPI0029162BEA|nr:MULTISPECIES: SIR2 family protein [unclassified Bradyrhizobium]
MSPSRQAGNRLRPSHKHVQAPVQHPSAPYPAYETDDAFYRLACLIRSSRPPIALIGAGASAKSGYPTWRELLERLREVASKATKAAQWKRNLDDISDAPWTAELFARELEDGGLGKLIKKEFGSRRSLAEPHLTIAKMPFPHFLTTNFDPSIEEALTKTKRKHEVVNWHESRAVSDFLINLSHRDGLTRVVYLHGRYDDDERNIILTESKYVSRYIASDDARRKLMAVFMTHPVVFIGFSMNDPDLANLMREVTARLQSNPPCHYAVMSYRTDVEREATRARMEGKYGVRPVFFSRTPADPDGDDYSNMVPLLEALAGRSTPRRKMTKKDSQKSRPAEFDPEDPHKGRFSGLSEHSGRRITVRKVSGSEAEGFLELTVKIAPLPGAPPILGRVKFHLHPTFEPASETVDAKDGSAAYDLESYGAFTIGIELEREHKRFEIDLATLPELPLWFRRQ